MKLEMDKCELHVVGLSEVLLPGKGEIVSGNYTTSHIRDLSIKNSLTIVLLYAVHSLQKSNSSRVRFPDHKTPEAIN